MKNQKEYAKGMITKWVNIEIAMHKAKVAECMSKLEKDFEHHFTWVGDDAYKGAVAKRLWQKVGMCPEGMTEIKSLGFVIEELETFLSRSYNLRENSTSELSCTASTWKYEVTMRVVDKMKRLRDDYEKQRMEEMQNDVWETLEKNKSK